MRARATVSVRKLVVMTLVLGPILGCAELQSASSSEFAQPHARPVESSGSAMRYVEIVEGRPCGDAGGVLMFIRNRHPSKGVKATIRIDSAYGPYPQWVTGKVAPGGRVPLRCSLLRISRGVMVFHLKITGAKY